MASAFDQYGYIATLANSVPDLKRVLNQALAGHWTPDKFAQEIQDTNWWKNSADSVKQLQILKATKPGEFAQQRDQMVDKVRAMSKAMGVGLGEGKGSALGAVVDHALALGWDDATLQRQIGAYYHTGANHTANGQAGQIQQQLREIWNQYGLGVSDNTVARYTKNILMGEGTVDGWRGMAIASAKSRYAGFAQQLDAGQTMQDIASPYVQTMAQTLELDPGSIDLLHDPYIQRALTQRQPDGKPTAQPLWAFQDALRQDSRYDHTTQAVNDAYAALGQIGKDFGFKG